MPTIYVQNLDQRVPASAAVSVLNNLLREGVPIKHLCGGHAQCGTCRIRIVAGEDRVSRPTSAESRRLASMRNAEGFRLACQTYAFGDITIRIPGLR
jgi:ferredoxin